MMKEYYRISIMNMDIPIICFRPEKHFTSLHIFFILNKHIFYRYIIYVECILALCIIDISKMNNTLIPRFSPQIIFSKREQAAIVYQPGLATVVH